MEIHIGFKTFKIEHKCQKEDELFGYVDFATNTIFVDPHTNLVDYKGTLLHEIYHVTLNLFGLGEDEDIPKVGNEYLTNVVTNMTQLVWALNKELFKYIFSDE